MGTHRTSTDKMLLLRNYERIPKEYLGRTDLYYLPYGKRGSDEMKLKNPFIPIFSRGVHKGTILKIVTAPS